MNYNEIKCSVFDRENKNFIQEKLPNLYRGATEVCYVVNEVRKEYGVNISDTKVLTEIEVINGLLRSKGVDALLGFDADEVTDKYIKPMLSFDEETNKLILSLAEKKTWEVING